LSLTNGGGIATTRGHVGGGHSGRVEKSAKKIKVKPSWINSRFSSNPDAVWRLVRLAAPDAKLVVSLTQFRARAVLEQQRAFRIEWFCCKKTCLSCALKQHCVARIFCGNVVVILAQRAVV
jgi:hypothetical protein